jgi:hypothetical protein
VIGNSVGKRLKVPLQSFSSTPGYLFGPFFCDCKVNFIVPQNLDSGSSRCEHCFGMLVRNKPFLAYFPRRKVIKG